MKKRKYKNSGYSEGSASTTRPTLKTYYPQHFSSKSDLDANLNLLQNRSADLIMNSPLGAAAINAMTTGVLSTGLQLFPTPNFKQLGLTAEAARSWSRRVKLEFESWANSTDCSFENRNNFFELQRLIFQSYLTDGDSFCLFRRRAGNYTLKLQAIEAKRVSNPLTSGNAAISNVEMLKGSHRIINGVEVDASGRQVAIHISNKIWNEPTSLTPELKWQRVKILGEHGNRNVLHICYDTRPDMFRGAPLLSPVIESLKQIARYSEAELTSSIVKSFFSLFFVQPNANFDLNQILPQEELDVREYKLGAGTISSLPRGVDVRSIESNNSQSTFDAFLTHFIKQVGAAIGIPFEVLLKNYQSSYSASRAALIEAEKTFIQRRKSFVNDFCVPVYEMWLTEAVASGKIQAPGFFDDEFKKYCWSQADFRTEVSPAIDPVKDANAARLRIEMGISTREIEAIKIGNNFDEVAEQLKYEKEMMQQEIDAVEI